ncbi:hypothetical protein MG293_013074 [Ovis ammon polii]|uniref:RING finger protein 207 n=1 Tax=Ovis ammon polii TaxID=230172 RepID=A0AAD4U0J1_OVIAM|nr:hypothetical protein MG293_013074 [Ovis ammon polii]KAI4563466.1 hypothetical protein MJT46_019822 [Ovis ammon polii x Ovis aries]
MSGAIFTPLEGPGALDGTSGHPLVCPLCHAQYERPCLLDCFHEFCAGCLRGRATDGRLACPLLGEGASGARPKLLHRHQTVVKGPSGLPPVDRLLQFLVDSSGDGTEVVRCANCDLECGKQDAETTYFCNTCGQPLCARCRDETHRARMFARHDIVALGQRSRDVLQKCTLHSEPYVLFSTDKKSLLCIRCFRDMQGWVEGAGGGLASVPERGLRAGSLQGEPRPLRGPRVSLRPGLRAAAAGGAGERGLLGAPGPGLGTRAPRRLRPPCPQEVKALQTATREAIELLQAMVEEVRRSAAEEEAAIQALFSSMQVRDEAACPSPSQYEEKDKAFKEQLSHLATLLPTLQVHLVICSSFLSLANKAEFLDLGYVSAPSSWGPTSRPHPAIQIASDHRAEFARCLEPLLLLGPRRAAGAGGGTSTLAGGSGPKVLRGRGCPSPVGKMLGSPVQKPTLHRSISTKVLLAEGNDSPFTEHCRHYEDSYRRLQAEMQNLKDQVQELHRDLTKHHSLIKAEIMGDILHKALQVDAQIASEYASVEGLRAVFQEVSEDLKPTRPNALAWAPTAQLHDLLQLKQENAYLTTITKQITPYIRSIAKVKERLEPR